ARSSFTSALSPLGSLLGVPGLRPPRRCPGFDPPPGMSGYFFDPTFDLPSETPEKSGYFLPLSSANCATFLISLRSALVKCLGHLIVRTPKSVQPPATHKPSPRRRCSAAIGSAHTINRIRASAASRWLFTPALHQCRRRARAWLRSPRARARPPASRRSLSRPSRLRQRQSTGSPFPRALG